MSGRPLVLVTAGLLQILAIGLLSACGGGGGDCGPGNLVNSNAVLYGVPTLQDVGNFYAVTEYT